MQTEELIRELARDAPPVRRLRPVALQTLGWLVLAVASLGIVALLSGVRRDLGEAVDQAGFAVEAALLIVTALSAAVGALLVSIPGAERTRLVRWVPVMAGAASILWVAGELAMESSAGAPAGRLSLSWACIYKTASVAAVPSIALFAMVRYAAPLRAAWAGFLAVLATAAVGVLGANIICPNDCPLHMLLWHAGPLMLLAGLGAALGTWLLRWPRPPRRGPAG